MSKTVSPGWGFKTRLHIIDGKFCNSAYDLRDSLSAFNCGIREITSVIIIAIPLKDNLDTASFGILYVCMTIFCNNETITKKLAKRHLYNLDGEILQL